MKDFEVKITAKSKEEMIRRLEAVTKTFEDDDVVAIFVRNEEDNECSECNEYEELREAIEDLQRAIATLTCYGLPIPTDLTDMYNDVRDRFLDYECVHEDDEEEDD